MKTPWTGSLQQVDIDKFRQIYKSFSENDTSESDYPITRNEKFLWIKQTGENIADALARVSSPVYQNSHEKCVMSFW